MKGFIAHPVIWNRGVPAAGLRTKCDEGVAFP
jgi:hypothetical protein